jgi:tetratricopeptide (TPR) repeat protein
MTDDPLFPAYIHRDEEAQIEQQIAAVAQDGKTRAVLLYGPGGIGKTSLVRELAKAGQDRESVIWIDPVDIDDSEYWLLSNLERKIAGQLDPDNQYFGPYQDYLSQLPSFIRSDIGHETVLSHLGRIKQIFVKAYREFVAATGNTVVIVFDTIETIRGMYLQVTLTQWMKALPATLFILSGRPPRETADEDPLKDELEDPHQLIPVYPVELGQFTPAAALEYLEASSIAAGLDLSPPVSPVPEGGPRTDEKQKLVLLTRGHPLWLAFAIAYLGEKGMPEEAAASLEDIAREIPYDLEMSPTGQHLHEEFKRRLVTPYREADFWHEAIKRLAVVRQSINEDIWRELMADYPLPPGVELTATWDMLLDTPWIRKRANGRFVTLHDAVAEELAQRIIPLHDQDQRWRRQLWEKAVDIYAGLIDEPEDELSVKLAAVDAQLRASGPALHEPGGGLLPATQRTLIQEVADLDRQKRELDQLKVARLFYQLLCDPDTGCDQFLSLFADAATRHDVLFQDLLALEMERFLPGGTYSHTLGDVIGAEIMSFRAWLDGRPARYIEISIAIGEYLIDDRPHTALDVLDRLEALPAGSADYQQRHNIQILQANACMRIPGRVRDGLPYLHRALGEAGSDAVPPQARPKLIAKAHKELGFYYRNEGMWQEADESYRKARDSISPTLSVASPDDDREEMASIQTNWAYVKGLVGEYRQGTNLVESAITVRRRLKLRHEEGISWSVCGEVYRYERRFEKAWEAFAQAEQIFLELRNWSWLGIVYQEQAICLFQAIQDGINLVPKRDPADQAKRLITRALDICRDQSVRAYPSALNRAGRIFGDEFDVGIAYLAEGIVQARRLSDGWFLLANLIEFVEANYRAWDVTGEQAYRDQITNRAQEILDAIEEYEFPDLKGRWELLQGHLAIHRWRRTADQGDLDYALNNYIDGFKLIAAGYVGSSGAAALPGEFERFAGMFSLLPAEIQAEWQEQLRTGWSSMDEGSIPVLARLEELY